MINLVNKVCDEVLSKGLLNPYESFDFSYASARLEEVGNYTLKMKSTNGDLAPTLTTSVANFGFAIPVDTPLAQTDGERIIEVENSMNDVKLKVVGSMEGGKWDNIHESCRRVYDVDGLSPTLNTQGGGNQEVKIVEKEYNSCDFRYDDGLRIRANGELSPTITTRSSATMSGTPMVVEKDSVYTDLEKKLFTEDGNIKRYLHSDIVDKFEEGQMATTTFPNGYDHGPRTHNESVSLNTIDRPSVKRNLRIRKLTPKECWRLMGFSNRREDGTWDDSAFERASKVNSNAQLYKQAGNSIVVDCLEAIFTNLFLEPDHTEYREISLF